MPSSLAVRRELWLLLPELDSGEIYELDPDLEHLPSLWPKNTRI